MNGYAFISHSSADADLARLLAEHLGKERVFVDLWNLDAGDLLPRELAEAIQLSKSFVLIASQQAMESEWVRYEVNLALIQWIERLDYKIIVARIDDCVVLPELSPFVRIDCPGDPHRAINELVGVVLSDETPQARPAKERRARIVDRFEEVAAIEALIHEEVPFIWLCGVYGIGKTTIVERAAVEVFRMPLVRFPLTEAHGTLRLTLEMAASAERTLPSPSASPDELLEAEIESAIRLIEQGRVILFDDVEYALGDDGTPRPFLLSLLEGLESRRPLETPVFLASTRRPYLTGDLWQASHIMRIERLNDKDLLYCLENWLRLAQPGAAIPPRDQLEAVVPHLYGYPLAARLAAYLILRYSVETLLAEVRHFRELRIDLAKQLLGRTRARLSDLEATCLQALAISDTGISLSELAQALTRDVDVVRRAVDRLASALVISSDGPYLQIHPLVKDYFWSLAYESGSWRELAQQLAEGAFQQLPDVPPGTREFVRACSRAYRLALLSGQLDRARSLTYQFRDELRGVAHRLFHAGEYELSLMYIDLWLDMEPGDYGIRWLRARCLTRLERYDQAEEELDGLKVQPVPRWKLFHAWGLLRREQRRIDEAAIFFRKGLDDRPDYVPLLRDLGHALQRQGDSRAALSVLRRAYDLAPRDPYVLPVYSDALKTSGDLNQALAVIEGAVLAFPEEGRFRARLSDILEELGRYDYAIEHAELAASQPDAPPVAILRLARLNARLDQCDEAERILDRLPSELDTRLTTIRNSIMADIQLHRGHLETARSGLPVRRALQHPYSAEVFARIEIAHAEQALAHGRITMATDRIRRACQILASARERFPTNAGISQAYERAMLLKAQLPGSP